MGKFGDSGIPSVPPGVWRPAQKLRRALVAPVEDFLKIEAAAGALLFVAAIVALAWANSPWGGSYEAVWHTKFGIEFGNYQFKHDLHFWVNEGLMAVFFFVLGLEIKREIAEGELSSLRRGVLPLAVALGGMVVPSVIYAILHAGRDTINGWGIPIATDLAFALGVLSVLGKRIPPVLRVVLLAAAIIDDLGSIFVIAIFYTDTLFFDGLFLAILGVTAIVVLSKVGLRNPWYFVIPCLLVWGGVLRFGVHPVSAGVLIGLLVPHKSWFGGEGFVNEAQAAVDEARQKLKERASDSDLHRPLARIRLAREEAQPPVERLLHAFHPVTAFLIMPLFALANAGVVFRGLEWPEGAGLVGWGVGIALAAGKPIGMLGFAFVAVKLKLCPLPRGVGFRELTVMALVAGIGFTMSMFIAELAFAGTTYVDVAKIGILVSSVGAALAALAWGRFMLPPYVSPDASPTAEQAEKEPTDELVPSSRTA